MKKMKHYLYKAFPVPILSRLLEWKERIQIGNGKTYYSQFGEDILLQKFFPEGSGHYVDVGANHPIRNSNTHLLYKRGWSGINIDPDPFSIALLKNKRKRDINLQCGIGDKGSQTLYRFSDSRVNTFSEDAAKEHIKNGLQLLEKLPISMYPLSEILEKNPLPSFDVLTVDAEGFDLKVLQSNDWDRYRPTLVLAESWYFDMSNPGEDKVYALLFSKGYQLIARAGYTSIFKDKHVKPARHKTDLL
jgi:FkbM family methyltransferase